MVQWLERGVLLLAMVTALIAIIMIAMLFGPQQGESRAFADAQYVSAGAETEGKP